MSRSGYTDDFDDILVLGRYRGQVASAIRGKRGQQLLKELRDALDAMPIWGRKLIKDELEAEDGYCALGVLGKERGIKMKELDPTDGEQVGEAFDIASPLAQEIVFMNDEEFSSLSPRERWIAMRQWVNNQIKDPALQTDYRNVLQKLWCRYKHPKRIIKTHTYGEGYKRLTTTLNTYCDHCRMITKEETMPYDPEHLKNNFPCGNTDLY